MVVNPANPGKPILYAPNANCCAKNPKPITFPKSVTFSHALALVTEIPWIDANLVAIYAWSGVKMKVSAKGIDWTDIAAQVAQKKWIILSDFSLIEMSSLDSMSRRCLSR